MLKDLGDYAGAGVGEACRSGDASPEFICMKIRLTVSAATHWGMLGACHCQLLVTDEAGQGSKLCLKRDNSKVSGVILYETQDGPSVCRENFLELAQAGLSSKLWHFAIGWPPARHLDFSGP